jgi:predicted TIM-barrel fold metal-dependent hydrolase
VAIKRCRQSKVWHAVAGLWTCMNRGAEGGACAPLCAFSRLEEGRPSRQTHNPFHGKLRPREPLEPSRESNLFVTLPLSTALMPAPMLRVVCPRSWRYNALSTGLEPTLEPELPICDPHHHFWDRRLQSLPYQRYLLDELHADISSGHNVRSTVFLEARSMYRPDGPVAMRPVGEVEFVQGLAAASASGIYGPSRAAAAIIGHADLKLGANVAPVLDALQAASPNRFRGIRHNVTWSPDPAVDNRESEGILANPTFREGAKVLSNKGFSLDVMISFPQMPEVADFARAVPELPIILNHIGALNRVGMYANREDEVRAVWQAGIAAVAALSQYHPQTGRHGHAPHGVRLAHQGGAHRLGSLGRSHGSVDAVLY